jgi:predicted small metal-binding protein
MIVSDIPELRQLISDFDCGWLVSAEEGAQQLDRLLDHLRPEELASKQVGAKCAAEIPNWDNEREVLKSVYQVALAATDDRKAPITV